MYPVRGDASNHAIAKSQNVNASPNTAQKWGFRSCTEAISAIEDGKFLPVKTRPERAGVAQARSFGVQLSAPKFGPPAEGCAEDDFDFFTSPLS